MIPKLECGMVYEFTNGSRALRLNGYGIVAHPQTSPEARGIVTLGVADIVKVFMPDPNNTYRVFRGWRDVGLIWTRPTITKRFFNEMGEDITDKLSDETKAAL